MAVKEKDLSNVTSKIHKTAESIDFIKKALYHESTLLSHLNDHVCSLKSLCKKHDLLCTELKQLTGKFLYLVFISYINTLQYKERLASVKTKNKKLKKLIQNTTSASKYKVPIINLSNYELSDIERKELEMGLEYIFVEKSKRLKQ